MTITLELLPEEKQRLQELARQQGVDAQELVTQTVKRLLPRSQQSREEIAQANSELFSHTSSLGYATGLHNAQIDADLAREYGNDHTVLYAPLQADNAR